MDDDKQILLAYLESAWRNIQHHDAVRLVFVILYYVLAACCFALIVFVSTVRHETAAAIVCPLFVGFYGLVVIRAAVRIKERIIRDMRIIFVINDRLLPADGELQAVNEVFKKYRNPKQEKKIKRRISSTRHVIFAVSMVTTVLVVIAVRVLYDPGSAWLGMAAFASLAVHSGYLPLVGRGVAFDI